MQEAEAGMPRTQDHRHDHPKTTDMTIPIPHRLFIDVHPRGQIPRVASSEPAALALLAV